MPGGGALTQFSVVEAAEPGPNWFDATTEYVAGPAAELAAVQVDEDELQPVHCQPVGDCVQFAVSVTLAPTNGDDVLAETVHTGGAVGGLCQVTETCAGKPAPAALLAVTP